MSIKNILEKFDEEDFARFYPATLRAWEHTKEDIKFFIESNIKEALEEIKLKEVE